MTSRTRNLSIIALVARPAGGVGCRDRDQADGARPGPARRRRAGLRGPADARRCPRSRPQAIDDAIETIRKRTDALGVSEPEIQRAGRQPDLDRPAGRRERRPRDRAGGHHRPAAVLRLGAQRARRSRARTLRSRGSKALFQAVELASKSEAQGRADRHPAGRARVADARSRPTAGTTRASTSTTCSDPTSG